MDFLANLINYLQNLPVEVWQVIGAMLGVSVVLQKIKTWAKLQSDKIVTFWLAFLSFIPVVIDYINSQAVQNPDVIAQHTLVIMGGATTVYRYIVKPITNILADARAQRLATAGATASVVPVADIQPQIFD